MKTLSELLAQRTLTSGEARTLAALLGHSVSPALYTLWCREAAERGLVAENRNGRWYVDRASWTEYLATPRPTGWQGHKDVKAGEPAKG